MRPADPSPEVRTGAAGGVGVRDVLRLAWPSMLSFLCNSAYRVNDQFWVQWLGPDAQAALAASVYLMILNFALYFVAVSGALALVARAAGARDVRERDAVVRHALVLGAGLAALLTVLGTTLAPRIGSWLGLPGPAAQLAGEYLGTIYVFCLPLALAPIVDTIFIGMGNTAIPLALQLVAIATNFALNPLLIYGAGPFEGLGIGGAALATCLSRALAVVLGLLILRRRFGVRWNGGFDLGIARFRALVRIGLPSAASIAFYAGVYFALLRIVLSTLDRDVTAALGIGFNAFEGVSFPTFLGVSVAGSSIVGRQLGAAAPELARAAVRSVRRLELGLGALFSLLFVVAGPWLVPLLTQDLDVAREAVLYLRILAVSQVFVALEAGNEKILLGAGYTLPILCISVPGNLLRVPLAWWLGVRLGGGAAGVWWAIVASTVVKAAALHWTVDRGRWARGPG